MIKKFIQFVKAKGVGPLFLVVDLFCGFGGTTTGYDNAMYVGSDGRLHKAAKVIACVNHDPKAIKSHWLNHPDVRHFEEDIRTLDLTELIKLVNYWRSVYPYALVVMWASLECTNYSKAKGGLPRNVDSRTLADHLVRYQKVLNPDYIKIENVVEFMSWGPLDEKGRPVSRRNGEDWVRWRNLICDLGYYDEWKEMNSADYGAYTSRNRLFGCFAKQGLPIIWPEPTHCKVIPKGRKNHMLQQQMFGRGLQPWKAVKEVLNFDDEGENEEGYSRARWQVDAHGFTRSGGDRLLTPEEYVGLDHDKIFQNFKRESLSRVYDFEHHVKIGEVLEATGKLPSGFMLLQPQSWSDDVWTDVTRMLTLNGSQWSKGKEMHLCPMQFDVADRVIAQMSNKGDIVFDPFGGLMTVPYRAIKLGRYGYGIELNPSYFLDGATYCKAAEQEVNMPTLFDITEFETVQP